MDADRTGPPRAWPWIATLDPDQLDPTQRAIVRLLRAGRSLPEVAAAVGLDKLAVLSRIHRMDRERRR
jgi:hypothetical protein